MNYWAINQFFSNWDRAIVNQKSTLLLRSITVTYISSKKFYDQDLITIIFDLVASKKKLMEVNFYYSNRQKLLKVAMELHHAGYEKLRIVPSLAPSGMHWRCEFLSADKSASCNASNWIFKIENENILKEILASAEELAKIFIIENSLFIEKCLGKDAAYVTWYKNVISNLKEGELPYAFADWEIPTNTWATNLERKISAYPNDKEFTIGTLNE